MISKLQLNEGKCGKKQCGMCGIPNPMNTTTIQQARQGWHILSTSTYQKSLQNKFGKKEAIKKHRCESERVKFILENKYGVKVKAKIKWYG